MVYHGIRHSMHRLTCLQLQCLCAIQEYPESPTGCIIPLLLIREFTHIPCFLLMERNCCELATTHVRRSPHASSMQKPIFVGMGSQKLSHIAGCVRKMAQFLEAALAAAEVPTFGRKEPERVIRMRATGARPGRNRSMRSSTRLPITLELLNIPIAIREVLREVFYTFTPSGMSLEVIST